MAKKVLGVCGSGGAVEFSLPVAPKEGTRRESMRPTMVAQGAFLDISIQSHRFNERLSLWLLVDRSSEALNSSVFLHSIIVTLFCT